MSQMLRTTQALPRETVLWEARMSTDGDGSPTYDSGVEFEANVVEYIGADGKHFITDSKGSRIDLALSLLILGTSPVVPNVADRVRLADQRAFIVVNRKAPRGLSESRDSVDHYHCQCRNE